MKLSVQLNCLSSSNGGNSNGFSGTGQKQPMGLFVVGGIVGGEAGLPVGNGMQIVDVGTLVYITEGGVHDDTFTVTRDVEGGRYGGGRVLGQKVGVDVYVVEIGVVIGILGVVVL